MKDRIALALIAVSFASAAIAQLQQTFLDDGLPGPSYGGRWTHVIRPCVDGSCEMRLAVCDDQQGPCPGMMDGGWYMLAYADPTGWPSYTEYYTDTHERTWATGVVAYAGPLPCEPRVTFDGDSDGDVDLEDFAEFQRTMGGPR